MIKKITQSEVSLAAKRLAQRMPQGPAHAIFGIPRGGVPAAFALSKHLPGSIVVDDPDAADIIVDDLIDSGKTMRDYEKRFPKKVYAALFDKQNGGEDSRDFVGALLPRDAWAVFPWEGDAVGSASDIVTRMLQFIGEDVQREGLRETPARVVRAWGEWFGGYAASAEDVLKTFTDGANNVDEVVLVKDIPFYSHCEHHLAPFFGVAHIGYIPNGKIVGLSKFPRLVNIFARRLQVQERLTNQIADAVVEHVAPLGVGVVVECRHLCMESRGIQKTGTSTMTSAMRGVMMTKAEARAELMSLIRSR